MQFSEKNEDDETKNVEGGTALRQEKGLHICFNQGEALLAWFSTYGKVNICWQAKETCVFGYVRK